MAIASKIRLQQGFSKYYTLQLSRFCILYFIKILNTFFMKIIIYLLFFYFLITETSFAMPVNIEFFSKFNDCWLEKYIQDALLYNHDLKKTIHVLEQYRQEIKTQFSQELPKLSVSSNYLGAR